jgi:hypothetical protein
MSRTLPGIGPVYNACRDALRRSPHPVPAVLSFDPARSMTLRIAGLVHDGFGAPGEADA